MVTESPLTIQQCWEVWKSIKQECLNEGLLDDNVDDNYYLNAADDSYSVVTLDGFQTAVWPTDVFPVSIPVSDELRKRFVSASLIAKERLTENQSQEKISELIDKNNRQALIDLLNSL